MSTVRQEDLVQVAQIVVPNVARPSERIRGARDAAPGSVLVCCLPAHRIGDRDDTTPRVAFERPHGTVWGFTGRHEAGGVTFEARPVSQGSGGRDHLTNVVPRVQGRPAQRVRDSDEVTRNVVLVHQHDALRVLDADEQVIDPVHREASASFVDDERGVRRRGVGVRERDASTVALDAMHAVVIVVGDDRVGPVRCDGAGEAPAVVVLVHRD
nr:MULTISPECIES: hypothetical protein [unclassified Curtobacterium]